MDFYPLIELYPDIYIWIHEMDSKILEELKPKELK